MEQRNLRMHEDLLRALSKPPEERSWVMAIDLDKCIGCYACEVACVAENALPPGVTYRKVFEVEDGEYPNVRRYFMPTNCQQCDQPPCVDGLPEDAYTKRPDGVLVFHYDRLKGTDLYRKVSQQCPYTAVYRDRGAFFTDGTPKREPYEERPSYDYGEPRRRTEEERSPVDAVRKCHFCVHRLEAGMLPACVTTCVGGAMYFGDANDPNGLIRSVLRGRKALRLYEEEGTQPRVWYLTGTLATPETCQSCHG